MKFLVDANVISELREPPRTNPGVRQWAQSVQIEDLATSVICLMELERGIARIEARDQRFHERLDNWLRLVVLPQYSGRILDVDGHHGPRELAALDRIATNEMQRAERAPSARDVHGVLR